MPVRGATSVRGAVGGAVRGAAPVRRPVTTGRGVVVPVVLLGVVPGRRAAAPPAVPAVEGVLCAAGAPVLIRGAVPPVVAAAVVVSASVVVTAAVAVTVTVRVPATRLLLVFLLEPVGAAALARLALALALLVCRAVAMFGMMVVGGAPAPLLPPAGVPSPSPILVLGWFVKVLWVAGLRWRVDLTVGRRAVYFRKALGAGAGAVGAVAGVWNIHTHM